MYEFPTQTPEHLKVLIESTPPTTPTPPPQSTYPSSSPVSSSQILAGFAVMTLILAFPLYSLCRLIVAQELKAQTEEIEQLETQLNSFQNLSRELEKLCQHHQNLLK